MNLSLTLEDLLITFENYNTSIWPAQIIAYVSGILAVFFAVFKTPYSARIVTAILSLLWIWTGIFFFLVFFGPLYTPAYLFGGLFIIQGLLFLVQTFRPKVSFAFPFNLYTLFGSLFILYAMVGYPLLGYFLDHTYPNSPPFGLTPCPLAVFTFGLFMLTVNRMPRFLLIIPLVWAIGGIMPVSVGIYEDIGMIVTGILATALILYRDRKTNPAMAH